MKNLAALLRDADPLRQEPHPDAEARARLRTAITTAAPQANAPSGAWFRAPAVLVASVALVALGLVAVGSQVWPRGSVALAAAIQFEVRLAEPGPADGLVEARIAETDRKVYLHAEAVVTNDDIADSAVVPGSDPSRFGVSVRFTAAGAARMRRATEGHDGRPLAILIDGEVVMAPTVRGAISDEAMISGDFTQAEAERIVRGIRLQ